MTESNSLTLTHLRFDLVVQTPLCLGGYQSGERLRDALARIMLQAVCPETRRGEKPSLEHAAVCPVCWLLAADLDPGEVRRAYSLVPPYDLPDELKPGQRFSFVLSLFGRGFQYLPYFVLAIPAMGQAGLGPGRGRFSLEAIWAVNPLAGSAEAVLEPGQQVVHIPHNPITLAEAQQASQRLLEKLPGRCLNLRFITPTRLVHDDTLLKTPDFAVFFRRLLERIDELSQQHAGMERRPAAEVEHLYALADRVRMVEADTHWVDLFAPSGRTGRSTPMGGLVGNAVYHSQDWAELLPWLVWGQAVQAGKLAVKGNGVYEILTFQQNPYWQWGFEYQEP